MLQENEIRRQSEEIIFDRVRENRKFHQWKKIPIRSETRGPVLKDKYKDAMEAPYRKIAAAEEQIDSNALLDLYVELYKRKFYNEPIFPIHNGHFNQIKAFRKQAGERAYALLQHYFEMKDEWFHNQAYSLDCLLKNLNKVNAAYGQKAHVSELKDHISIPFHCDSCWHPFTLTVKANYDFNRLTRCVECEREKRPIKTVTKEERRAAILKYGATFVKLPKSVDIAEEPTLEDSLAFP